MKPLVFLLFTLLVFQACAKNFNEDKYFEEKNAVATKELQNLLDTVTYKYWVYERGIFDCSNQTAYLFDFLSEKGYDCTIVCGGETLFHLFVPGFTGHAWLMAEKDGHGFVVESTEKLVQKPGDLRYFEKFKIRFYFKSLGFLRFITALFDRPDEWTY